MQVGGGSSSCVCECIFLADLFFIYLFFAL